MDGDDDCQNGQLFDEKRTQQSNTLTTTSTSLEMASIKAQTHFWWVFGSTAPLDVPMVEHPGPCLAQSRCSRRPPIGRSSSRIMSSQTVSTTLTLVLKNLRKSHVSVDDQHPPSRQDEWFIRPRAIPQKLGIASKGLMGSWSSSSMILVGLVVSALVAMVERGWQWTTRGEGRGDFFMREGVSYYRMVRVVFVCGVLLLLLVWKRQNLF